MTGPYFIGIGTVKSGTTWWYKNVIFHPNISPNLQNQKELHFFNMFPYGVIPENKKNNYLKQFDTKYPSGEWTPGYLTYPMGLENIAQICPKVKIIVILRDPIERLLSLVGVMKNKISDCRDAFSTAFMYSKLSESIDKLFQLFEKNQILILQYEKCIRDPNTEIKKTFDFLEVPYVFNKNIKRVVNKTVDKYEPNAQEIENLKKYLRDDIVRIKLLVPSLDFSLWKEFK